MEMKICDLPLAFFATFFFCSVAVVGQLSVVRLSVSFAATWYCITGSLAPGRAASLHK
jgi:hypothetical protein